MECFSKDSQPFKNQRLKKLLQLHCVHEDAVVLFLTEHLIRQVRDSVNNYTPLQKLFEQSGKIYGRTFYKCHVSEKVNLNFGGGGDKITESENKQNKNSKYCFEKC